jgi:hypothetical protein
MAIFVGSTLGPPTEARRGHPENLSGNLVISNNDIDVGGTAADFTLGITVFSAGKSPSQEADLRITGNNVRDITERAINVNLIGGRVSIEGNSITTGAISGPSNGVQPDAIHAVGSGSYIIAHNSIVNQWATGAGIRVQGSTWSPEASAIVMDNDVTMSAAAGTTFGANSAGIDIRGAAQSNVVLNNRIRGRARAALAQVAQRGGTPGNNTFVSNDLEGFQATLRDIFVDAGVAHTTVLGRTVRSGGPAN